MIASLKYFYFIFLWISIVASYIYGSTAVGALPMVVDSKPLPSLAPMLDRVLPSVVNIYTESRVRDRPNPFQSDPFFEKFFGVPETQPRERRVSSLGSGVIIDADSGFIITNSHVIDGADEISVRLHDGRSFKAERVGNDSDADIAVIKIPSLQLKAISIGNSDELRVGDFVVAIGNPFGLGQTATSGIVSALGRTGLGIEGYEDFIQTDASINRGNSGGALVNLYGELIGVNTAILAPGGGNIGIGFAIPINMATLLTQQIIKYGEVRRGRLGVIVQNLTEELSEALQIEGTSGAVISQVMKKSAAEEAGLQEGDVIIKVEQYNIENASALRNAIGLFRADDKIDITFLREGQLMKVSARIHAIEPQQGQGMQLSKRLEGARLADIDDKYGSDGKLGVKVIEVLTDSPAWRSGLRENDLIISVNKRPVYSLNDVQTASEKEESMLLLNIRRGESALFIVIR